MKDRNRTQKKITNLLQLEEIMKEHCKMNPNIKESTREKNSCMSKSQNITGQSSQFQKCLRIIANAYSLDFAKEHSSE